MCEEARTQTAGRGTELPLPHAAQRDSIANKQGKRALGRGDGKVYLSHDTNDNIERQPECGSLPRFLDGIYANTAI